VRSGGHSNAGLSTNDGGMVIDLGPMNEVRLLDPERRLVRLGSGATWLQAARTMSQWKLAVSSGDTTTVGVGGLLCAGGIGWIVRRQGLAIDHVVAVEVVTADGDLLRATAEDNPELFWGIRGGGGNLGIATAFELVAWPNDGVFFGSISYPATERAQVLRGWSRYQRSAPEELTSIVQLVPSFGGAELPPVSILACYGGSDPAAAQAALEPLLHLGTLLGNTVQPMPYHQVLAETGALPPGWQPWVRTSFAEVCSDELIDTALVSAERMDRLYVELRALGGAMRRVSADATAFAHRNREAMLLAVNLGGPDDHRQAAAGYHAFWDSVAPYVSGAYIGFMSELDDAGVAAVYPPETYARLADLKRVYDPENIFRRTANVPPS